MAATALRITGVYSVDIRQDVARAAEKLRIELAPETVVAEMFVRCFDSPALAKYAGALGATAKYSGLRWGWGS